MSIPCCAYCVQISTTRRESASLALVAPSRRIVVPDELDRPVGARGHRLDGRAREPEDHGATHDQAEQERRVQQREVLRGPWVRPSVRPMMIEKIIVVAPTTAVPMSTGLAVALKVFPAPSFSSSMVLAVSHCGFEPVVPDQLGLDVVDLLDHRELVDALGVVRDRAVGVDRDGDRPHAQEPEGEQPEREHGGRQHQRVQAQLREQEGAAHEADDRGAEPVGGEVAGDEAGQDVQATGHPRASS